VRCARVSACSIRSSSSTRFGSRVSGSRSAFDSAERRRRATSSDQAALAATSVLAIAAVSVSVCIETAAPAGRAASTSTVGTIGHRAIRLLPFTLLRRSRGMGSTARPSAGTGSSGRSVGARRPSIATPSGEDLPPIE
jgi:hypothetical protein